MEGPAHAGGRFSQGGRDPRVKLARLQRWLAAVIQHPRLAEVAIAAPRARALVPPARVRAGEVIVPARNATVLQRLDVYGGGYLARLVEGAAGDHPGLRRLLGEERFQRLIARYVVRHPSRHPNLNRFGKQLPAFVARQRWLPQRAFASALARLEVAMASSFDAPEFTPLDPRTLGITEPAAWAAVVLHPNPSLHLLALRYPANRYLQAVLDGKRPRLPGPRVEHVAIYRKSGRVWRMVLPAPTARMLARLIAGVPIGRALAGLGLGPEAVARWFGEWSDDGFFVSGGPVSS